MPCPRPPQSLAAAVLLLLLCGCSEQPLLDPPEPAPQQASLEALRLGLAPPPELSAPDAFERHGLVASARELASSYGTVAGPLPGLTPDQLAAFHRGGEFFGRVFTPVEGQGPLANSNACAICHQAGGIGGAGHEIATRMALVDQTDPGWLETSAGFYDMPELGGPVKQGEGGVVEPLPDQAAVDGLVAKLAARGQAVGRIVVTSLRSTPNIAGDGLLSAVPDAALLAREALLKPFGITGHVNRLSGAVGNLPLAGRLGRLGHKAQLPDNQAFFADAAQQELGLTNPLNPYENALNLPAVRVANTDVLLDTALDAEAFCVGMAPPRPAGASASGQAAFFKAGCAVCHYTGYTTATSPDQLPQHLRQFYAAVGRKPVPAYSDLLVHHLGTGLADGFKQGSALGAEWRTAPLWGLRFKTGFMHDRRAVTLPQAIAAHKSPHSEANQVIDNYLGIGAPASGNNLSPAERDALLGFLAML